MKYIFKTLLVVFMLKGISAFAQVETLLPMPTSIAYVHGKGFLWEAGQHAEALGICQNEVDLFNAWLKENEPETVVEVSSNGGLQQQPKKVIFQLTKNIPSNTEAYSLTVRENEIRLTSATEEGISRGMQTLKQLLPKYFKTNESFAAFEIPCMDISDAPAFPHRGMLLDCGRHFMDVATVKKYIDALAFYKMNVLHWHLTEDQGWRIEIKKYPELTRLGSYRMDKFGNHVSEGYYTQEQIKDIVAYAQARHVTIIPEIEMPGHSVAAISAYPWLSCTGESIPVETEWGVFKDIYCAGNDSTVQFLKDVMDEVCALFPSKYIHIGGDEAPKFRWEHCDKCQKRMHKHGLKNEAQLQTWLIEEMSKYLYTKGRQIIGWDEILEGGIPADAMIQSWRGMEGGIAAAKQKHGVVMSPTSHCYLDYGLDNINMEKVYNFNPLPAELNAEEAKYIRGAEGNMWTERAPQEIVDSKVFPRLLALSEVLWTAPKKRDYEAFAARVGKNYERLDQLNIKYGFPDVPLNFRSQVLPTGEVEVRAVTSTNSLVIVNYRKNEEETSQTYSKPIIVNERYTTLNFEYYFPWSTGFFNESRVYTSNLATGKMVTLSYTPSVYYPGGGENALVDGRIGTENFRDGIWQGVQGKNMEVVIDLGDVKPFEHVTTRWFHYANAWIFRPKAVEVYKSMDGIKWDKVATMKPNIEEQTSGELIDQFSCGIGQVYTARYIKVIGINNGPCPEWHDAVGEPSWLFCDEIVID
jgi:hexosaminidase